ncbi:MAG: hypothetical protein KGI58_02440 [Patescibacteria group bacterium]|nr:hypothetical protein [Patescibacteria group bacterium]
MESFNRNQKEYTSNENLENENPFSPEQESFLEKEFEKMEQDALTADDFLGKPPYDEKFVNECNLKVKEYEDIFEKSDKVNSIKSEIDDNYTQSLDYKVISKYLEALFYNMLGGKKGWIPNALVWKTSKFDDYINGIDFVVETENREFTLGTDVTFSHSKGLTQKLNKVRSKINLGKLSDLTFYESDNAKEKPMPHVIIAVERNKIIQALKLWADGQENLLYDHPLKAKTLLEIEAQLEAFALYAKAQKRRYIAASYNDMLAQIQRLIIDHEDTIKKYQNVIDNDEAYKTIIKFCNNLKDQINKTF